MWVQLEGTRETLTELTLAIFKEQVQAAIDDQVEGPGGSPVSVVALSYAESEKAKAREVQIVGERTMKAAMETVLKEAFSLMKADDLDEKIIVARVICAEGAMHNFLVQIHAQL